MADRRVPFRVLAAGALLAIFGAAGTALAADRPVAISGFSFSPGSVTVAVGDTVTWTNSDAQAHTATADDSSWDTGTISNNASRTITFSTAGTFAYHCDIHPNMTGTVVVQAAASGGGGATTPPTDTVTAAGASTGSAGTLVGLLVIVAGGSIGFLAASRRFATKR